LRGAVAVYRVNQDIGRLFRVWDGAQKPGFRFDRRIVIGICNLGPD
jgi:hypothetical protein